MQRDLKIGLSLAVLLIGVVGALFFRRDDSELAGIPELKTAWEIDQQIAQRGGNHIPYLPPNRSEAERQSSSAAQVAETRPSAELLEISPIGDNDTLSDRSEIDTITPRASRTQLIEAMGSERLPRRWSSQRNLLADNNRRDSAWEPLDTSGRSPGSKLVPEPIPLPSVGNDEQLPESPAPMATRKRNPVPVTESEETTGNRKFSRAETTPFTARSSYSDEFTEEETSGTRYYEVQPGDTLERIAYKQYGHRGKVEAIMEANRDVIADPHRISIGMKLRIP